MGKQSTKPDIILLHGLRGAPIGLSAIKEALEASGYTVYVPAVPPFAHTKPLPEYTPEAYANHFADWIRKHQLNQPVVIGHSMGSIVAAALAAMHPDLVDSRVILLSPISERAAGPFRLVSPLASLLPSRLVDYVTSRFLFAGHQKGLFSEVIKITNECGEHNRQVKRSDLAAVTKFSSSYGINDILASGNSDDKTTTCPQRPTFYLIAGAKDRLVGQKSTQKLAKSIDAKLTFIPNTGHLHNYEKPVETAQLIVDILK